MEAPKTFAGLSAKENTKATERSEKYDLIAQLQPSTWKVIRKSDRQVFLARDVTDELFEPGPAARPKPLLSLLNPDGEELMASLMCLLNHENLINLVDWIQVKTWRDQKHNLPRHFFLYDFCNAGTLENLFMPEQLNTSPAEAELAVRRRFEVERAARSGAGEKPEEEPKRPNAFLPESLCWHVLCSVLKALAWLHHGLREDYNAQTNEYEEFDAGADWLTVLHRDITASNIFFCHPQTKMETYGLCKLGNLGKAFVSGHFNGVLGGRLQPADGKVLAGRPPEDGKGEQPFAQVLEKRDEPECHPPQWDQPYTILSEYRALGDVLMAMMVQPIVAASSHLEYVRDCDQEAWNAMFEALDYSPELKKFLYELMSKSEAEEASTYRLYQRAAVAFQRFRQTDVRGQALIQVEHVQIAEAGAKAQKDLDNAQLHQLLQDILEKQDAQFTKGRCPAPSNESPARAQMLDEIQQVISAEVGSGYDGENWYDGDDLYD